MTSCIVGKKIRAVASGHLRVISLCCSGYLCVITDGHGRGISEHMLSSWSSIKGKLTDLINQTFIRENTQHLACIEECAFFTSDVY